MKIRKGDNIQVISGKDKGKTGKVLKAFPSLDKIIVDGVNVKKRHQKPTKANQHGQVIDKTLPVHVSNVMLIDPKTKKPTRVKYKVIDGKKTRITQKSGTKLES